MREEASKVLDSVKETIAIGEQGGLPTQVTHHKVIGATNWGRSVDTLRAIDEARARGVDATIDRYPYTASSTSVQAALLPRWAQEGGRERVLQRLRDPATRAKIRGETAEIIRTERGGGDPKNVQLASCGFDRHARRQDARPTSSRCVQRRRGRSRPSARTQARRQARNEGGEWGPPGHRNRRGGGGGDGENTRAGGGSGVVARRAGRVPGCVPRDWRRGSRADSASIPRR